MKKLIIFLAVSLVPFITSAQSAFYQDISASAGINNTGGNFGVSVSDYDNDGWEDVYVSINDQPNKLYRNNGDNTFTDMAATAGVADEGISMCSVWLDIDNDGWLDLYVGNRNTANKLYYNNGDGTFTDISQSAGVMSSSHVRSINAADVNNDGLIDIYVANLGGQNVLYHNNGNNTFSNLVFLYGATDTQIAQAAIFFDYDNDRDQDLYITHDANQTFILYQNNGLGYFTNVAAASGTDLEEQGMGVDVADYDNNGYLDIYATNLNPNSLLKNNGDGTFEDVSADCGMGDPGMSWGTTWLDFNNDGLADNYMVNDSYFGGGNYPNLLYKNMGNHTFEVVSSGMALSSAFGGYGSACADFNNDGKTDIFVANRGPNDGNQLFLNTDPAPSHWLQVKVIGTVTNKAGIGTRVEVFPTNGSKMIDEVNAGNGFASQSSHTLHFGLGDQNSVQKIRLLWPSGLVEEYLNISADQMLTLTEGEGSLVTSVDQFHEENISLRFIYPNPVQKGKEVAIHYELSSAGSVTLEIYSLTGKSMAVLQNRQWKASGQHTFYWHPVEAGLSPGVYLVKIEVNGQVETMKMVVPSF